MTTPHIHASAREALAALPPSFDDHPARRAIAAAVIRAVADVVVPVEPEPPDLPFPSANDPWPHWDAKQDIRRELLAIASELEVQP